MYRPRGAVKVRRRRKTKGREAARGAIVRLSTRWKERQEERVVYYDSLTDDFAETNIRTKTVDENFPFMREDLRWKIRSFFVYRCVAVPIVFLYTHFVMGLRIKNRHALRKVKGGCFLYANHTHMLDGFTVNMTTFPKPTYIIANPDAVSIKGLRSIVQMLGVIPIPQQLKAMPHFIDAVEGRANEGGCVVIYPEAHIWPYCDFLRPFPATSFRYPVRTGLPVLFAVTTYRERRSLFSRKRAPASTVTLSDPVLPDPTLSPKEAQRELCLKARAFMQEVLAESPHVPYVRYEQRPADAEDAGSARA